MDVASFLEYRKGVRPLAAARHELGYSVEALASTISMGAPTIRGSEWGLYANVPPRLKAFYTDNGFDGEWIKTNNNLYRLTTRVSFGEELGHRFPQPSRNFLKLLYRNLEVGRLTLAKCLCVQAAELLRMDSREGSNFPDSVFNALSQIISPSYAEETLKLWEAE